MLLRKKDWSGQFALNAADKKELKKLEEKYPDLAEKAQARPEETPQDVIRYLNGEIAKLLKRDKENPQIQKYSEMVRRMGGNPPSIG